MMISSIFGRGAGACKFAQQQAAHRVRFDDTLPPRYYNVLCLDLLYARMQMRMPRNVAMGMNCTFVSVCGCGKVWRARLQLAGSLVDYIY